MAPPVAVVTGASSGIGFALMKHLLAHGWDVVQTDIAPPFEQPEGTLYIKCDIASWDDQAILFKNAYAWQGRLDLVFLNAGIDDRDDIFDSISKDPARPPTEPSLKTFHVNLGAQYYGVKLAAHYLSLDSKSAGKHRPGGKIVVTSSRAGVYPNPCLPQYVAAKHGLVGMVRSMASVAAQHDICINAVLPSLTPTPLSPPGLLDHFDDSQLTPMSTIMRAFSEVANIDTADSDTNWVGSGPNGDTVEGFLDDLIWHRDPGRMQFGPSTRPREIPPWMRVYIERNKKWGMQDWKKEWVNGHVIPSSH